MTFSDIKPFIKLSYSEVQATLRRESEQRVTAYLCDELLEEVVEDQIAAVGGQIHFHDVIEKDRRLEETYKIVRTLRLRRYFKQWRNNHMGETFSPVKKPLEVTGIHCYSLHANGWDIYSCV